MTRTEVARRLSVSVASVRRLEARGDLRPVGAPGEIRTFDPEEVEALAKQRAVAGWGSVTEVANGSPAEIGSVPVRVDRRPVGEAPPIERTTTQEPALARLERLVSELSAEVARLDSETRLHHLRLNAVGGRIGAVEQSLVTRRHQ